VSPQYLVLGTFLRLSFNLYSLRSQSLTFYRVLLVIDILMLSLFMSIYQYLSYRFFRPPLGPLSLLFGSEVLSELSDAASAGVRALRPCFFLVEGSVDDSPDVVLELRCPRTSSCIFQHRSLAAWYSAHSRASSAQAAVSSFDF